MSMVGAEEAVLASMKLTPEAELLQGGKLFPAQGTVLMLHSVVHGGVGLNYTVVTLPNRKFLLIKVMRSGFDDAEDLLALCGSAYELDLLPKGSSEIRMLVKKESDLSIGILCRNGALLVPPKLYRVAFKDLDYATVLDGLLEQGKPTPVEPEPVPE